MFNGIRGKRTELTFAEQVQQKLSDAMYKTSRQNSVDIGMQALAEGYGLSNQGENLSDDNRQYEIKTHPGTNYKYVKASRQVITGDNPTQWATQVYNYINDKIRKGEDVQVVADTGEILTITEDTAGKARFREYIQEKGGKHRLMSDEEYAVKLRAESHIDELSSISKKRNERPDKKNHSFARDGFDYRVAYFEDFDGVYYRLTISVGKNGNINTVYNVNRIKEALSPSGSKAGQRNSAGGASASKKNIPQNPSNVKPENDGTKQYAKVGIDTVQADVIKSNQKSANDVFVNHEEQVLSIADTLRGMPGILYNNGATIKIPNSDMEVLRHTFKTAEHYSNRTEGLLDCIACSGRKDTKHYFYLFYKGDGGTVAPIFRLDFNYLDNYSGEIEFVLKEMGYEADEFIKTQSDRSAQANDSGVNRVRNLKRRYRSGAFSMSEGTGYTKTSGLYNRTGRQGTTADEISSSRVSDGWAEEQVTDLNKQYMIPSAVDGDGEGYQPAGDLDMDAVYEPGQENVEYLSELRPEFAKERTPERIQAEKQTVDAVKEYFQKESEALGVEAFEPGTISDDAQAVPDSDMDEGLSLLFEDPAYFRSLIEDDPKRDRLIEFSEAEEKSAEGEVLTDDKLVSDAQKTAENEASLAGTQRFSDNDTKYKRRYLKTAKRLDDLLKDSDFSKVSDPEFRESAFKLVNGYRGDRLKTEKNEISSFFEAYGTLYSELHWATEEAKRVEKRLNFEGDMHRDAERIGEGTLLEQELSDAWTAEQREAILELGYALKAQNDIEKAIKEFSKGIHKGFYDFAESLLKDSDKFNDLKIGMKTLVSPDRIFKYVAGDTNANEKFERFVISRLQEHNGDVNRDLENMYVRFKAIGISRNKKGRNKVSEDYAIQWFGEAEGRVAAIDLQLKRIDKRYTETRKKLKEERDDINARITQFKLDNPDFDYDLLLQKKEKVQALYDDMYTRMNIVRMMHGYAPLPYLKNYFHHFMDAKTNFWGKLFRYNPGPDVQLPNKFYIHDIEIGADSNTAAVKGVTDVRESTPISNLSIQQNAEEVNQKHIFQYVH